jgi:membrane-bound lytic murein transglycosylase B
MPGRGGVVHTRPSDPGQPIDPGTPRAQNTNTAWEKVQAAARKYGIAASTLWGVYGTESDFGRNLGPSSKGARGPFQFLPSTAQELGVNPMDFDSAVDGAARYLKSLGADGSADSAATAKALNSYSGGGGSKYVQSVKEKGAEKDNALHQVGPDIPGAIGDAASAIPNFLGKLDVLFQAAWWKRVGLVFAGVVAILLGVVWIGRDFIAKAADGLPVPIPV